MGWLSLILGVASLVGSIALSVKQSKQEEETTQYNKDLNNLVMEREDNSWQRAVADRSKAGLSVAGLSSGAGSGGTVSQLQAPQSSGQMANLLQNFGSQSFGLADSAYNRKLQKQIATDQLEVQKQDLDQKKREYYANRLTSMLHYKLEYLKTMKDIEAIDSSLTSSAAQSERDAKIFEHNYNLAKSLNTVYGSDPDVTTVTLGQVADKKEELKSKVDDMKSDFFGTRGSEGSAPNQYFKSAIGDFTYDKIASKGPFNVVSFGHSASQPYTYWVSVKYQGDSDTTKFELSKSQFEKIQKDSKKIIKK